MSFENQKSPYVVTMFPALCTCFISADLLLSDTVYKLHQSTTVVTYRL